MKKKKLSNCHPIFCRVRVKIPRGVIIKKVHQCSLCSSNYAEGGYSSNYCRGFIYEKPYQPDLVELSGELENFLSPMSPPNPPFFFLTPLRVSQNGARASVCMRGWGGGQGWLLFVFFFPPLWWASNRFAIKTHFIHLCTFIYTDHVLTSQFCFTCHTADTNMSP